jgi:hypothetical protein
MSVEIIALIADWQPAVEAYRSSGTDFYFELDEDEEPPFAEVDDLGGFKRFLNTESFYYKLASELPASERERLEPFLRLIGAYHTPEDWEQEFEPANDLLSDAGGPPPEDPMMFAMRPSKVPLALEFAEAIPWEAVEAACGRLDLTAAREDVWRISGFDDFSWILTTYINWIKRAAATGRGLIVIVDM